MLPPEIRDKLEGLLTRSEFQELLNSSENILQSHPDNQVAKYYKAEALSRLRRLEESLVVWNELLQIYPSNFEFLAGRGMVQYHLRNDDAIKDFNQAVLLDPENPYRYSSRAFVKSQMGDSEGAMEDYQKAIELDPNDAVALNNLGLIEEKLGWEIAQERFALADELTGIKIGSDEKKVVHGFPPQTKEPEKPVQISRWTVLRQIFMDKKVFIEFLDFLKKK